MGRVASVGGKSVGCSGDWARGRLIVIGGSERVVDSGTGLVGAWVLEHEAVRLWQGGSR